MYLAPDDDLLAGLEGVTVRAQIQPEVEYQLSRVIGAGSYSVAFYTIRKSPDGESPVVLKIVRPSLMRLAGQTAILAVEKEAVALGRLNERVPPTPFVVRLLASDIIDVQQGGVDLRLPWLALEYVHGGAEGTTLEERVEFSVEQTGFAFDPHRAELALSCLANGLEAIHEVGVVHRDLSPHNVLCCGFGKDEIFKIADFGIARPQGGSAGTFVNVPGGTPGYTAPEQVRRGAPVTGPEGDVFGLAAIAFKLLTGEDLFPSRNAVDGAVMAMEPARRSITECPALCPELRERVGACATIDRIIARGTSPDPRHRPPTGWELVSGLLRALRSGERRSRPPRRRFESITDYSSPTRFGWGWRVRHQPGSGRTLRSVAWDGDGRCLAATGHGLLFWNGTNWVVAGSDGLPDTKGIRFVERVGAGTWLVGGDRATIATYSSEGASSVLSGDDPSVAFTRASGGLEDLAVLVGERQGDPPLLFGLAARHWMKPATLSRARTVVGMTRLEDERWLIAGESKNGDAFAVVYSPLMFEVELLTGADDTVFSGCASQPDIALGAVVGSNGRVFKISGRDVTPLWVPNQVALSAVAVDIGGRIWAASPGRLWVHEPEGLVPWKCLWQNESWTTPFLSLFVDVGRIVATTRDGAVVEGRWEPT